MKTTKNFKSEILKKANQLMAIAINFTNQDDDYSTEWWDVHEFAEYAADFFLNDETTIHAGELLEQALKIKEMTTNFESTYFEPVHEEWKAVSEFAVLVKNTMYEGIIVDGKLFAK